MDRLPELLVWYLVFVFSTTCHEAAHAFVAMRGGDRTAYSLGHVSLDPMPHIRREPFGMVIVPILSFLLNPNWMIGWASVPYDPTWGSRHPKRWAAMSLAGPGANFALMLLAFAAIRGLTAAGVFELDPFSQHRHSFVALPNGQDFSSPLGAVALGLSVMLRLNLILGIFNLLPVPPLDGAAVVQGFGPSGLRALYQRALQIPLFPLLGLVLSWQIFPFIYYPIERFVMIALFR